MKCPACSNNLHPFKAGLFEVDICKDGCSGIWFEAGELDKCNDHTEIFPAELLRVKRIADVAIDRNKILSCPACIEQKMDRIVLDVESRFEIDRCPKCQGQWLDIGELEHLRNRSKVISDLDARIAANSARINAKLNDPATAHRVTALLRLVFPSK